MSETLQVSEVVERLETPLDVLRFVLSLNLHDASFGFQAVAAIEGAEDAIKTIRTLQSENEALRAAGEEARRALEPFADLGVAEGTEDYAEGVLVATFCAHDDYTLTFGQFRLASKAHRGLEEVLGEEE